MKRISFALAATLATTPLASAQVHKDSGGSILPGTAPIYIYVSAGSSQWALSVSTNTTLTVPSGATIAEICVESSGVRYTDDGSSASSTNGIPVVPSSSSLPNCFSYTGPLASLKFTAISGSPTLSVSYYRAN